MWLRGRYGCGCRVRTLATCADILLENVFAHTPDGAGCAIRLSHREPGGAGAIARHRPGVGSAARRAHPGPGHRTPRLGHPRDQLPQRRTAPRHHSRGRDGVPASAFAPAGATGPGRLAQRDFDLGRQVGLLPAPSPDEPPPAATAVLLTAGDLRIDW